MLYSCAMPRQSFALSLFAYTWQNEQIHMRHVGYMPLAQGLRLLLLLLLRYCTF